MAKKLTKVRVQIIDADTKLPKEDVDVITSADCVYFPDGKTFQEKWEEGDFQGLPGEDGIAATVRVGNTSTVDPGNKAIVENVGTRSAAVLNFSIPKGEKGDPGTSIKILSRFNTYEELIAIYPDGSNIDGGFLVGPEAGPCDYYFWDTIHNIWSSMGPIQGPQGEIGEKGDPGKDGMGLAILTSVPNYTKLIELYPDGSICNGWGIITIDTREYWYWDTVKLVWKSAGCILGQKGEKGDSGKAATIKIGNVYTSENGYASITNTGDEINAVFDFVIPKGEKGDPGNDAAIMIESEVKQNLLNPVSSDAVYNKLQEYSLQSHEHLYAGSDNPGGAANTALECTGNSATATADANGNEITKTYVAEIINEDKTIKFLSKSGELLFELDKSNTYNLPVATTNTLGGIKIDNDTIGISNGSIYAKNNSLKLWSTSGTGSSSYSSFSCTPTISGVAIIVQTFTTSAGVGGSSVVETHVSARSVTANNTISISGQGSISVYVIGL